jgi:hypothetical protein
VAGNVIAEVDGPGESGWGAVGVVGEAAEEASDAADRDAEREGNGVEVAGGSAESDVAFREFDGDEPKGEGADNSFASDEIVRVVEMLPSELRVFEPEEKFGTECSASDCSGYDRPTQRSDQVISEAAAE